MPVDADQKKGFLFPSLAGIHVTGCTKRSSTSCPLISRDMLFLSWTWVADVELWNCGIVAHEAVLACGAKKSEERLKCGRMY